MTILEKLTKLRDNYKKQQKFLEAKAVQRAIDLVRK